MVRELSVENLALIEHAILSLEPGFTVITGETGAGKSLLIDALQLALGERASATLVRSGAARLLVNATFDLTHRPDLLQLAANEGLEGEDGHIHIQREVFAEGRSLCRVNGKLAPVASLKRLGTLLVDMHGQHEHQLLLDPLQHVGYLDAWIGGKVEALKSKVAEVFEDRGRIARSLADLRRSVKDREHRLDLLTFQVQEISEANPLPGELKDLEVAIAKLRNSERLAEAVNLAKLALIESETSATDTLGQATKQIELACRFDESAESTLGSLRSAQAALEDALIELRSYEATLDASADNIDDLQARLDLLRKLIRKYSDEALEDPLKDVLAYAAKAQAELDTLMDSNMNEQSLREQLDLRTQELQAAADALTDLRASYAQAFTESAQQHLRDLAMDHAVLQLSMERGEITPEGQDMVEFLFSANPGEPVKPLAKIASGGEISRVMLALKATISGKAGTPMIVFDEVDSGLSGRAAALVARKIRDLAQTTQVVVISHLPQMAGAADHHVSIEKVEVHGRTRTQLRQISGEERIEEIARMLAGESVSEPARQSARELLDQV